MNRIYWVLLCLILTACGGNSIHKPALVLNAESYSSDAMEAYQNEQWLKAQRSFHKALSVYQSIDDRLAVLISHINLVEVALAVHDKKAAYHHLIQAEYIVSTDGLVSYQSRITLLHALLAIQQKQLLKAGELLQTLLPVFVEDSVEAFPNAIELAAIVAKTKLAFSQKQHESIWVLRFAKVLTKLTRQNTALEARLLRFQAKLLFQQGDYLQSITTLQKALALYKENLSRSGIAGTLLELGEIYQKQGDKPYALSYFKRAISVYHSLGNTEKVNEVTARLQKIN